MANSRIYLPCRHCGAQMFMGKGYYGKHYLCDYHGDYIDRLNDFYDHHGSWCEGNEEICCTDNARKHFIILEEGETWNPKTNSIEHVIYTNDDGKHLYDGTIKMPDNF